MFEQIIPPALMIISAAAIIYIFGRRIPDSYKNFKKETKDDENLQKADSKSFKEKLVDILEKILRKLKIIILKSDARLMQLIRSIQDRKKNSTNTKSVKFTKDQQESILSIEEKNGQDDKEKGEKSFLQKAKDRFSKQKEPVNFEISKEEFSPKQSDGEEELQKKDKTPILERMNELREKLNIKKEEEKKPQTKSKKKIVKKQKTAERTIDLEEARQVMFEREEESLIKRISSNPKDDNSYVELGKLYLKADNLDDAIASFNQALKINKGNISAKKFLKEIKKEMG
ncbi:MAG: hypothetical protein GF335_00805 [Candidatus Moranbacteria bacterium]|nr:hypothetical protein [Candidatus Moranbacteria bacterium]